MQATSDEALIARIASGDQLAMQVLFGRHQVRVYRFILRQVRNPAIAEELLSEVFLEVWRQAGKFEGRSAVTTWMLGMARLMALSTFRHRERQLYEGVAEQIEDQSDTPETDLAKRDKAAVMRECMTLLSAEHREIVDLVYYHEKSVRDCSDTIG